MIPTVLTLWMFLQFWSTFVYKTLEFQILHYKLQRSISFWKLLKFWQLAGQPFHFNTGLVKLISERFPKIILFLEQCPFAWNNTHSWKNSNIFSKYKQQEIKTFPNFVEHYTREGWKIKCEYRNKSLRKLTVRAVAMWG